VNCGEVKSLLNGYADGEVKVKDREVLSDHIQRCEACSAALEEIRSIRGVVRQEMKYYEAPVELRDRVRFAIRSAVHVEPPAPRMNWRVLGAVAAALLVAASITTPVLMHRYDQRQALGEELLSAHLRSLLGRDLDVVSSDQHTVKPWFNGKLPFSPPVTDLKPEGFPLEGGRLDYASGRPVAALVYRRALHRIDVFVWPSSQGPAPAAAGRDGFHEISWTRGDFVFTAISDLNAAELNRFAGLLQTR